MNSDFLFPNNAAFSESQSLLLPSQRNTAIVVLTIIVLVMIIPYIIFRKIKKEKELEQQKRLVRHNIRTVKLLSSHYNQLLALNSDTFYYNITSEYYYRHCFQTKQAFDMTDCKQIMMKIIADNLQSFEDTCNQALGNRYYKHVYQKALTNLAATSPSEIHRSGLEADEFLRIENQLCADAYLKIVDTPTFYLIYSYISPKGRNFYEHTYYFSLDDIIDFLDELTESARQYDQRAAERAKMTPGLRYKIMQRDGFRCRLCGASAADGAKLHVDHIFPVSKGGKTEPDNLRTLCERCNLGKSARYNPNGMN